MAALLLLLPFGALSWYSVQTLKGTPSVRWRHALLRALLGMAALTYLLTELLSAFGALRPVPVVLSWAAIGLLAVGGTGWAYRTARVPLPWAGAAPLSRPARYLLLAVGGAFLLPLGLLAVGVPPNNHDALAYHLARVAHWMQHGDVAHYPTVYAHQLSQTPLSEFLMLHLHLLSGTDALTGGIQYVALLGSMLALTLLIRRVGGGAAAQVLGVVWAVSIPMAVFQSTSAQNDLLAGFFFLCFLVEGTKDVPDRRGVARRGVPALLALALGALTKYTVLVFALPFALLFWGRVWTKTGPRAAVRWAGTGLLLLALALGPHWARNYRTFGHVIGPVPGSALDIPLSNQPIDLATVYSNTVRNFFNPWGTPVGAANRAIDGLVRSLHHAVGLPVDAPGRNYLDTRYQTVFGYTEDTAGSLLHLLLFVGTVGYLLVHRRRVPGGLLGYTVSILLAFVLFSALLRYQLWHARLLLPLTLAAGVPVVWVLAGRNRQARRVGLVGTGLLLSALPWVYLNKAKPLVVVENLARRVLNTPHELIPERDFRALLRAYPRQARFVAARYRPDTAQHGYRLRADLPAADRTRLVAFFDSIKFRKRYPVYQTSRTENYLQNKRSLVEPYGAIVDTLARRGLHEVGLDLDFDPTEYPLWALLRDRLGPGVRMRYVRYDPLLTRTPHAPERFGVRAIVTAFRDLPARLPAGSVAAVQEYGEVRLILLHQPTDTALTERRWFAGLGPTQ
jgi:hypothetical protein